MREPERPDPPPPDALLAHDEAARPHVGLALIEATAFAAVRRRGGARAAARLIAAVAAGFAARFPAARVERVGRSLVEVTLYAPTRPRLEQAITALRADLDAESPLALRMGVAIALGDDADHADLIDAAEAALACEKSGDARQDRDAFDATELESAIERGEFVLHYQPKLHVRRQAIASVEALIRWRHPLRGLVMPSSFIPAAERTGVIGALTLWTLRQVAADQQALAEAGFELPVFVNIAGALLSDTGFVERVLALVRDSGARLGFEITETSVIREPERAIAHLNQFAAIGIAIAIDDYGAGLSSLAYLKQLPARELKIDKLFVTQLASSHRDPLIVRSTIDLAHALEMEVVAEGVETATSLALLSVMGCDLVQGYLISRPLPLAALIAYLDDEGHRAATEQARSPLGRLGPIRVQA